ncbi:putative Dol-P-Glc:Glc(2)Man(9)GlcNAc(2)-PP-Dol alpha-1,2-glucosyltransferase isoform X2 [Ischnura elegans]|uniref:putative Dol-P-Glc:Glc(2)Man(9)GlcNAc(2)-PP-Dol alpha-1,2-glucosyltransferase isoform X2 n=1 Tax=Ischnura elegans TaxID=197161 RepID=UPI001ED8A09D|nr:putative Dol-P-Glc:Glc(2)Man(9)GlcNAc(2)-PP-Dol alpha-1,2-glucosyltransferase isoform X2 [Ischnura elegans]
MFEKEGSDEKLNFDIKSVNHAVGLVVLFSVCTFIVFNVIYNVQETPYLDEVFHIPQAIRYCNGSFDEWDPKITTLPGLYIFSAGLLKPYGWVINRYLCTVYRLRGINLLCSIANLILFIGIRHKAVGSEGKFTFQVLWAPLNLALFPVLYFFTFLYYTDQISTLMVMIMYRLYLARKFNWSAFIGILSVMCRQTNIIWVAFCALEVGLETLETHLLKLKKQRDSRNFLENLRVGFFA